MNKVAFLSVVFPGVELYLEKFLLSLSRQSKKDFDLYVLNDGLMSLDNYLGPYIDSLNCTVVNVKGSPAKNRELGINLLIERGYEIIIFGDSDDFFSENRVEKDVALLGSYDVVVNELSLVDQEGELVESDYLSNRLDDCQVIDLPYIYEKNIFGLSNTAINTRGLKEVSLPESLIAVDWFLFCSLLKSGRKAVFTKSAITFYRQHASNTVGIRKFSKKQLLCGVHVKSKHYKALAEIDDQYLFLRDKYVELEQQIKTCPETLELLYKAMLEKSIKDPLWWEQISLPELL